jgi:beta-phosphoglucomutase
MPHALLFDMDGVIVHSMPFHIRAWNQYLAQHNIDANHLNARMHGKHNHDLIREYFGDSLPHAEIQRIGNEKEALYRQLIAPTLEQELVPGLRAFLDDHRATPKAVASNAEPANVNFVLDQAALRSYFPVALDGYQVERGKPDPEIYLKAASLLEIEAADCIVFEDSQAGIDAGLAAGMTVVGINTNHAALHGIAVEASDFLDSRLLDWLQSWLDSRKSA